MGKSVAASCLQPSISILPLPHTPMVFRPNACQTEIHTFIIQAGWSLRFAAVSIAAVLRVRRLMFV